MFIYTNSCKILTLWRLLTPKILKRKLIKPSTTILGKIPVRLSFLSCIPIMIIRMKPWAFFAHAREYRSFLSWARMRTRKNSSLLHKCVEKGEKKNCRLRTVRQAKCCFFFIFLELHVPGIFVSEMFHSDYLE